MSYIPKRGDIIWLDFDPSSGHEIMKRRPALVISLSGFSAHFSMAIVAPITNTKRNVRIEVELNGTATQGSILAYQVRTIDYASRNAEFIEHAPRDITEKVSKLVRVLISEPVPTRTT